jgi:hypothetical protein
MHSRFIVPFDGLWVLIRATQHYHGNWDYMFWDFQEAPKTLCPAQNWVDAQPDGT